MLSLLTSLVSIVLFMSRTQRKSKSNMADREEKNTATAVEGRAGPSESKRGMKRKANNELRKQKKKNAKSETTKKPGFAKELYEETTCYVKNGLRHVQPYYFTFTTYCKGRWVARTLIDVFKEEFRLETEEYYEKAIKAGKITVNGCQVPLDTILKDNDVIRNKVHRHEPPVVGNPLEIVELSEELVVLNKPSSIPVHPCGRYRHNTIVFLLGKEHGLTNLYTIHRIDRLTSGILMFARTLSKAQEIENQVRNRHIEKEYVCRVQGEFPSDTVDCEEPILVVSHKVGVCRVSADGKPCRTVFTRMSYNGQSSVVKCVPYTGRMHQIRVHLQWLGYPIINDPIYNHESWGTSRGRGGVSQELVLKIISELAKSSTTCTIEVESTAETKVTTDQHTENKLNDETAGLTQSRSQCNQEEREGGPKNHTKASNSSSEDAQHNDKSCDETGRRDEDCSECHIRRRDPTSAELTMCLHALSYKGPTWEFRTELPIWAEENWNRNLESS